MLVLTVKKWNVVSHTKKKTIMKITRTIVSSITVE